MLLINLGTPDAPEAAAVRRYLAEFLSDPRVIEIPRIAWLPILHGIILRTRPKKSAHAYKQVWTEEGSPLAAITRRQAEALQKRLGEDVDRRFRDALRQSGHRAIDRAPGGARVASASWLAPLYPQYCAATTASAIDAAFGKLASLRLATGASDAAALLRRSCFTSRR